MSNRQKPRILLITFTFTVIASCAFTNAGYASGEIPTPAASPTTATALKKTNAKLKTEQKNTEKLKHQYKTIAKQANDIQKQLINVGRKIQKNEQDLYDISNKISSLTNEKNELYHKIEADKENIAQLIIAMDRLKKIPFIALAARPGSALETAQNAMIIEDIGLTLKTRTQELKNNTQRIEQIIATLGQEQEKLDQTKAKLKSHQAKLNEQISIKKQLLSQSSQKIKEKEKVIKRISAQANTLQELISKIEEQKEKEEKIKKATLKKAIKKNMPSFTNIKLSMPTAGTIKVHYGDNDHLNAKSKGVWIDSLDNALVLAPYSGKIRFIGQFKTYGNIVIIEHKNNYHSLIAGVDNITVDIESEILKGEPIGRVANTNTNAQHPKLYYELRKSGKAIDPEQKFSNL